MSKRSFALRWTGGLAIAALALAACSDGDSGGGGGNPPPGPGPLALEDQFGTGFGRLFRAQPNTDPAEPQATDVIGVSVTTDPAPVP